jgi:8-oxo-dGTP pyrophosphatase MutT (NUDIX family)
MRGVVMAEEAGKRKTKADRKAKGKPKPKASKQYAALPYTVRDGQLLVMLVTSRETHRWVIPKGWPIKGLKPPQVAAREAYEEAGIVGEVARKPYSTFTYLKRINETLRKRCAVDVFLFAVHQELGDWPEKAEREREWMTPAQAAMSVAEAGLIELFLGLSLAEPE